MKKILLVIGLFLTLNLFWLAPIMASNYGYETAKGDLPAAVAGSGDVYSLVGGIIQIFLGAIGIVFFILMLYAGIKWMTARGNQEEAEKAKEIIQAAIIGLVIISAAYSITNFIFSGLQSATDSPEVSCADITDKNYCQLPLCSWNTQQNKCEIVNK